MGDKREREPLLVRESSSSTHLSLVFAVACIVDQFGVNPIVVLPRAIILCGWVGYPLALFVFSLTIYTAILLGRCWIMAEHLNRDMFMKSRYPYTALMEMALGKTAGKVLNLFLNIGVFTSNIPALVIASLNLQTFDAKISNYANNFSYCYWLIILGVAVCPLTWLGSPKDTKWISIVSTASVFVCGILTWTCMLEDETSSQLYEEIPSPNWQSVGIAFGILAFQFGAHPAILTIQTDMHDKSQLSHSILYSFLATSSLSLITTSIAFVLYGSGIHANLTQGLPGSASLYVDLLAVTLQLFLSTVVGGCTIFHDIEDKLGIPRELCWQRCATRTAIVMLAVLLGEMLPRFDLVMGLFGGLLTGPITFIFPPLLYWKFRKMVAKESIRGPREPRPKNHFFTLQVDLEDGELSSLETVTVLGIMAIGATATVTATYYSLRGAVWSTKFLPPCIYNVKAASNIINT